MKFTNRILVLAGLGILWGAAYRNSRTCRRSPGRNKNLGTKALDAGAALVQRLTPIEQMNL